MYVYMCVLIILNTIVSVYNYGYLVNVLGEYLELF